MTSTLASKLNIIIQKQEGKNGKDSIILPCNLVSAYTGVKFVDMNIEWPTFQVRNETSEQRCDDSFWDEAKSTYDRFKRYRGEVIEAALFAENSLTNILLDFFSYPSAQRRTILRNLVFDAEFCTFFQKWKLLRQLLDIFGSGLDLDKVELKTLKQELHQLISLRNRFAHGEIYVDARDFSVWIEYVEGGKKLDCVNDTELSNTTDMCDRIHGQLYKIHKVIESFGYKLPEI